MLDNALCLLILAGMGLSFLYLHGALRTRRVRRHMNTTDELS